MGRLNKAHTQQEREQFHLRPLSGCSPLRMHPPSTRKYTRFASLMIRLFVSHRSSVWCVCIGDISAARESTTSTDQATLRQMALCLQPTLHACVWIHSCSFTLGIDCGVGCRLGHAKDYICAGFFRRPYATGASRRCAPKTRDTLVSYNSRIFLLLCCLVRSTYAHFFLFGLLKKYLDDK